MKYIARSFGIVGLCAVGLAGLYFKVDYAGWCVFVGLFWAAIS